MCYGNKSGCSWPGGLVSKLIEDLVRRYGGWQQFVDSESLSDSRHYWCDRYRSKMREVGIGGVFFGTGVTGALSQLAGSEPLWTTERRENRSQFDSTVLIGTPSIPKLFHLSKFFSRAMPCWETDVKSKSWIKLWAGWYLTGGTGGHVPLTRFRRPPHWNWFSDPWVGCV